MSRRIRFVNSALKHHGEVVLWGALDCSELVCLSFKDVGGPDWTKTHTAQTLHDEATRALVGTEEAEPGDLVLHGYHDVDGKLHVTHVGILLVGGKVLSADGATKRITTRAHAEAAGARVRVHDTIFYRQDLPYVAVRRFVALDDLDKVTR